MAKSKDDAQQEVEQKVDVPDGVSTTPDGESEIDKAAKARGEYMRMLEKNKDVAKKYGEPDFASLLSRIGSDGNFAQQVVMSLLNNEADIKPAVVLPDSPQEKNITGVLDHTGDTAVKVKTDTQATNPATAAV